MLLPKHFDLFEWLQPFRQMVYGAISRVFGELPFYEDSSGMYALLLVAPILGLLTASIAFVPAFRERISSPGAATRTLLRYFLVLELWEYGWAKLVKAQFYLPEPNTVYTELGALSKDIAYWSIMGSSRPYVVFMGVTELVAGSLLLFHRTRFLGLLLALGIFINVCMVNFAFDISVKLFAASLLAMTIALLTHYPEQWRHLVGSHVTSAVERPVADRPWKRIARAFVLALITVETIHPSILTGSLNDDTLPRPEFHNAYRVRGHVHWKDLYMHRDDYLIAEDQDGRQLDWKITAKDREVYTLLDERTGTESRIRSRRTPNGLEMVWRSGDRTDTLFLETLPYRDLPLLRSSFHWFSDDHQ